jgi:hypothetical protein
MPNSKSVWSRQQSCDILEYFCRRLTTELQVVVHVELHCRDEFSESSKTEICMLIRCFKCGSQSLHKGSVCCCIMFTSITQWTTLLNHLVSVKKNGQMHGLGKKGSRRKFISEYSLVGCLQYFGGRCHFSLSSSSGTLKMEATDSCETFVTCLHIT